MKFFIKILLILFLLALAGFFTANYILEKITPGL